MHCVLWFFFVSCFCVISGITALHERLLNLLERSEVRSFLQLLFKIEICSSPHSEWYHVVSECVSCRWWTIPSSQAVWITPGEECVWELRLQAGCEDSEMTLALSSHHLLRRLAFHPAPWIQAHEGMCVSAAFFPVPYTCVLLCLQHSEACYQAPRDGSAGRPATQRAHRHYWDAELPTTGKWGRNLVV